MNTIFELNYLFDRRLKWRLVKILGIIMLGAGAELVGVSIILPIVNLATNKNALQGNSYCRTISRITGFEETNQVLLILLCITVMIYVIKNVYLSWMTHKMNCFSKDIRRQFAIRLMESYMKQPYSYFLNKNTAEIMRSINNDTVNLYSAISNSMQVISQVITVIFIIGFLAVTNPMMTLVIALLLGGCAVIIILFLQRPMRRMGREFQKLSAYLLLYSKQAFEGIKDVKIQNKEGYFIDEYDKVFDKAAEIEKRSNLLSYIPKYLIETVCIGGIMGFLGVSIVIGGDIAELVPQLAVFTVGAFKLLPSINAIYTNFSGIIYHKASIDIIYHDIKEVEKTIVDFREEPNQEKVVVLQKCIQLDNISFSYDSGKTEILTNVNLEIKKGLSVAFIGESGGGKTTLVDIILGLLDPQGGKVLVDGKNIQGCKRQWHNMIGYIPQVIFLLDDSIKKNVAFGVPENQINQKRLWEVLEQAHLKEFVEGLAEGLETNVGEAGTRLSGGQRQRIGIARALYHNPDVLIFDEATSALDNETEKEVMEAIDGLHGKKTMIMVAHRLTTIENCDEVYRVSNQSIERVR